MAKHSKLKTPEASLNSSYIVIPLITLATGFLGSMATSQGLTSWYKSLILPSWTPPGSTIGLVWTTIYILTTISALVVWNSKTNRKQIWAIMKLFLINAILNALWSNVFFGLHQIGLAVWVAAALGLSVIILMRYIAPISKLASLLLLPYALWVSFATYLNYLIWNLNQ